MSRVSNHMHSLTTKAVVFAVTAVLHASAVVNFLELSVVS